MKIQFSQSLRHASTVFRMKLVNFVHMCVASPTVSDTEQLKQH